MKKQELFDHTVEFSYSSGMHPPGYKGMTTADMALWIRMDEGEWFRPYGRFSAMKVLKMLDICKNEFDLISMMEMLSAKKVENED